NRTDVIQGAEGLGIPLEELIAFIVDALILHAQALGLNP
ncbi:MAG: HAD family hydrolase, partial [Sulfobacillus thermosulfidooxidans]